MLAVPTVDLPHDERGRLRAFVSPEITGDIRVSQSFQMTGPQLQGFDFQPATVGPASGDIALELHDITGHGDELLRGGHVRADQLVQVSRYRFTFAPIAESTG